MSRKLTFLFTMWEGGGNVPPILEAVRKLIARGHRVRFNGEECNRSEVEASGASFVAWATAPNRRDRRRETQGAKDWAAPTPQEGLLSVIRDLWCGPSLAYARDVIAELRREPADIVVTSECLFGVMAGCESLGQTLAILSPNISLAPLPGVPPMGPGLPPARTPEEHAMHAEIARGTQAMFDSGLSALNATRAALGLEPLEHVIDQYRAARLELLATSQAFDFPADPLPTRVRYVGPQIIDPHWAKPWTSPWPASDERDLVVVGFSTTFQNHAGVLQNVIDALASLPVRVLVTLGGSIEAHEVHAAENCVIVDSAPHTVVMRDASLVVTHGGHGTVMRALASRTPMLVIPHGRDQNDNAVRVTERGAGLSLKPEATVDAIRDACSRLLREPHFRTAAERLGVAVVRDAQASPVAAELEALAAEGAPVRSAGSLDLGHG